MRSGWGLSETVKQRVFEFIDRLFHSERGRGILARSTESLRSTPLRHLGLQLGEAPYGEIPRQLPPSVSDRSDIVIISARFRSGSTLPWNLFRNIPGNTAYYEPLNERRWFDPAVRGERVDATHRQVGDYWKEYAGLEELAEWYNEDWIRQRLYLDANAWEPRLKRYVERLVEKAPGRPVLQFNRIDFRLPWFRQQFPNAKFIHLYRHPRDQWCSALIDPKSFGPNEKIERFPDHFYLRTWVNDLQIQFPFLRGEGRHPYELFYLIWRMSHLFGTRFCHYSLSFEHLLEQSDCILPELVNCVGMHHADIGHLKSLLSPPIIGKWAEYADDAWFRAIEERCEEMLYTYLRSPNF